MVNYPFTDTTSRFPKICGIYAIKAKYKNAHLVGQTARYMAIRWREHRKDLRNHKHENPYLQKSFDKHGESQFDFVLLEKCPPPLLNEREVYWIKELKSMQNENGWNMREGGGFGKYGPELRRRISRAIRSSEKCKLSREAKRKTYTLISPDGNKVTFLGLAKFCRENNLSPACLWRLLNNKNGVTHHKGWTLNKMTES